MHKAAPGPRRRASRAHRARNRPPGPARPVREAPLDGPTWAAPSNTYRNCGHTDLKLHQDASGALNTVTGYGPDYVDVNLERHEQSVIVLPGGPVLAWPVSSFDALAPEHFAMLLEPAPEVVIFGSGARLRFPHPRLVAALTARRIGVETMDFQAACRTYNILMAEGRKVAAALLIER